MLIDFFMHLKNHRLPVSTTEYLALLDAVKAGLANCNIDDFYTVSRLCMVKSEANYDKFDVAFGEYVEKLRRNEAFDTPEAALESLLLSNGGHIQPDDDLLEQDVPRQSMPKPLVRKTRNQDKEEEKDSPLTGAAGKNELGEDDMPQDGLRVDNASLGNRSVVKAWDSREFTMLDEEIELNTRSIKIALRRLRRFAREGTPEELDLENTVASTARNAGWLDLKMRPERRNKVKVLIMFDVSGSMDVHVKRCEELFSAARSEFKQLEWFYFKNVVGDSVWRYNSARVASHYSLQYIMDKYGKEHKLIFVGDASMGTVELTEAGDTGINNNFNTISGEAWMRRLVDHYRNAVWLNPERESYWHLTRTVHMLRDIMGGRMFPLTLSGLERAMKVLSR